MGCVQQMDQDLSAQLRAGCGRRGLPGDVRKAHGVVGVGIARDVGLAVR